LVVSCACITILQHWWLWSLFWNYMNVFNAVMPPSGAACVRVWRGRQSGDLKNWKFLYVVFCLQLGAGRGNTSPWLGSNVSLRGAPDGVQKLSFKI
jgi:hypothetical protein